MANPTEIINAITTRLSRHLWIQRFDIDEPPNDLVTFNGFQYPANAAFIAPAVQISINRSGAGQDIALQAELTYPFTIQYRFNKSRWPTMASLPLKQLTTLYSYIGVWLALIQRDDVTDIKLPPRSNPITLAETENPSDQTGRFRQSVGDWLVTMWFDIQITFNTSETDYNPELWGQIQPPDFPGVEEPEQPIVIEALNIGIYRNKITVPLDTEQSSLDHIIELDKNGI